MVIDVLGSWDLRHKYANVYGNVIPPIKVAEMRFKQYEMQFIETPKVLYSLTSSNNESKR